MDRSGRSAERGDDRWSRWLRSGRFTDDPADAALWHQLHGWRDAVLDHAALEGSETVLDVGTGEGLIGHGALDRLGPAGTVIFSDISPAVLSDAHATATSRGDRHRSGFLRASADALPLGPARIDVVTTRSVLVYVHDKPAALSEFHRVLAPGGRLSICEPITSFNDVMRNRPGLLWGYDVGPYGDLADRIEAAWQRLHEPSRRELAVDFDERDLFVHTERAGFDDVHIELSAWNCAAGPPRAENWEAFIESSPNPFAPSRREALEAALSPAERAAIRGQLRPQVESAEIGKEDRGAVAYLWATKR